MNFIGAANKEFNILFEGIVGKGVSGSTFEGGFF